MFLRIIGLVVGVTLALPIFCQAQVKVKGYTRKDGTYVAPHERSAPNAYKWDNKSSTPSQDPYNKSYTAPTKNYGASWYTPNPQRFADNNPNNNYPPSGYAQFPPAAPKVNTYTYTPPPAYDPSRAPAAAYGGYGLGTEQSQQSQWNRGSGYEPSRSAYPSAQDALYRSLQRQTETYPNSFRSGPFGSGYGADDEDDEDEPAYRGFSFGDDEDEEEDE
jgi:hypothetical protein